MKEICVCYAPNRKNNLKAATQLGRQLKWEKKISGVLLKKFSSSREMCEYIKSENSICIMGLLPFFDNIKQIIPASLNVLDEFKLFASGIIIVNLGRGNIKKRIPSRQEFIVVSSRILQKISSQPDKNYQTIAIIKELSEKDIKKVDELLVINNGLISYNSKFEPRTKILYFKINCHSLKIKTKLFKDKGFSLKILGSYQLPAE